MRRRNPIIVVFVVLVLGVFGFSFFPSFTMLIRNQHSQLAAITFLIFAGAK